MPTIDFTSDEIQQLITVLVDAPWKTANPLLVKIQQAHQGMLPASMPPKANSDKRNERRVPD
jgi:hypothetical protein